MGNVQALQQATDAERAARAVQESLEQMQREADHNYNQALLRQQEADRAAARAAEETAQLRERMKEVARVARHAQELTEAAVYVAREVDSLVMGNFMPSLFGRCTKGGNLAEEIKNKAAQDSEQAWLCQEEADQAVAQAAEEMASMRAQMEESANAARRAQELAEAASKVAKEGAKMLAREAQEERERAQRMRDEAQRAMDVAREEAKKAQQAADEQRREAEAAKALVRDAAHVAAEETQRANEARREAERRLKEGIQPIVTPTAQEVAAAKKRVQYREDCFHFAIAGISGSGKSSLVNAFRGLRSRDPGAAAVGVTETTLRTTRYHDADPNNPYVWYDVPGAGTFKCSDWQYFNDQGLYIFDCIIVLFDNRFTSTDLAILTNARRFQIPAYIVRSKADQHIRNLMIEMGYDSDGDEEEDIDRRNKLYKAARKQFVDKTRKSVRDNLEDANFPDQRVYIISNTMLLTIVTGKTPKKIIDELELLNDLGNEVYARRKAKHTAQ